MQAIIIILLSLGFTAGVLVSKINNEQISAAENSESEKTEVVHIESGLDSIDDNTSDSLFPIL